MATWYVNKDGDNTTGDGLTVETAWLTINKALTEGSTGDTIIVGASEEAYAENSGSNYLSVPAGIWTIQSDTGDPDDVIITGTSTTAAVWLTGNGDTDLVTFNNITIQSSSVAGIANGALTIRDKQGAVLNNCKITVDTSTTGPCIAVSVAIARTLELDGCTLTTPYIPVAITNTCTSCTITDSTLTSTGSHALYTATGTVGTLTVTGSALTAAGAAKHAFNIGSGTVTTAVFTGCTLTSAAGSSVDLQTGGALGDITFDGCTFDCAASTDYAGIKMDDSLSACGMVKVVDCTFTDAHIDLKDRPTSVLIDGNTLNITTDNRRGIIVGANEYQANVVGPSRISNNTITFTGAGVAGHGILLGFGSNFSEIVGNKIYGADYGIVCKSDYCLVSQNRVYQATGTGIIGIYSVGSDGCHFTNNTVYAAAGVCMAVSDEGSGDSGALGTVILASNTFIFDNILVSNSASVCLDLADDPAGQGTTYADYNIMYNSTGGDVLSIEHAIITAAALGVSAWADAGRTITSGTDDAFAAYTFTAGDTFQPVSGTTISCGQRVAIASKTNADVIVLSADLNTDNSNIADLTGNVMRKTGYTGTEIQASTVYDGPFAAQCDANTYYINPLLTIGSVTSDNFLRPGTIVYDKSSTGGPIGAVNNNVVDFSRRRRII